MLFTQCGFISLDYNEVAEKMCVPQYFDILRFLNYCMRDIALASASPHNFNSLSYLLNFSFFFFVGFIDCNLPPSPVSFILTFLIITLLNSMNLPTLMSPAIACILKTTCLILIFYLHVHNPKTLKYSMIVVLPD